jgi:peptidoglycan hydrolase-like protein with peptidoglycan-binding domain
MKQNLLFTLILFSVALPGLAIADDLTRMIQQDLQTLGYDPGNTDGEATVPTVVAISKFQAEHDLEVTGEATPQLAGVIKATISQGEPTAAATSAAAAPAPQVTAPAPDLAALQAAQQACLQQKVSEREESAKRKRGFARLAQAVTRSASRLGSDGVSEDVSALSSAVYDANAIASDLQGAAEDLGLTDSDIEDCRNPS